MSAESNKRKSKCHFKKQWLQNKGYKDWIKKIPDDEQEDIIMTAILVQKGKRENTLMQKGKTFIEMSC